MEKIDLNNYEAYFLDLMEGTLSVEERHDLFAFLELHPELKAEMEADFGALELNPAPITFDGKAQLKIDEAQLILTPNTIDDIMIASVEGQLSTEHDAQLTTYIAANNLEKTFAYYKATLLKADTSVVYTEKKKLKVKTGIVISLPLIMRFSAIAAVGVILLTVAFRNWDGQDVVNTDGPSNQFATVRSNSNFNFSKTRILNDAVDPTIENGDGFNYTPTQNEQYLPDVNDDNIAMEDAPVLIDTATTRPFDFELPKDDIEEMNNDDIVEENQNDPTPIIPIEMEEDPGVVLASVTTEEPYKIVTDAASNLMNRDVKFTRDRSTASNDYVAYGFKLGKFEFERKKSR
ncbi:MAG: hypothetical protein GQ574_02860 [Crocinitomix sp.]|nr:hypothetical protein [Crocinitomix sp.]